MARTLWVFSAIAVVYGTLIPFEFHRDTSIALEKAAQAFAFQAPVSKRGWISTPDIVQNVLLFLPFGFFAYLASSRLLLTITYALVLSAFAETMQLWTLSRVSSWLDLVTNGTGALLGFVFAPYFIRAFSGIFHIVNYYGLTDSPRHRLAASLLILALIHHLHPFAFTLDIGMLWRQAKALTGSIFFLPEKGDGLTLFHWFTASCLVCIALRKKVPLYRCALLLATVAFAGELCQFVIRARVPGFHDLLIAFASIGAGALTSSLITRSHKPHINPRQPAFDTKLIPLALALFVASMAWDTLHPFELEPFHGIAWIPFTEHYNRTTFASLSDSMELVFAGIALAFVFFGSSNAKAVRFVASGMALAIFSLLELSQAWIVGRYAGTGDIAALTVGIWLGLALAPGLFEARLEIHDQHDPNESLPRAVRAETPFVEG